MCPLLPLIGTQENLAKACHKTDEATFGLGGKYLEAGELIQHNKPKMRVVPEMEPFTPPKSEDTNWEGCCSKRVAFRCRYPESAQPRLALYYLPIPSSYNPLPTTYTPVPRSLPIPVPLLQRVLLRLVLPLLVILPRRRRPPPLPLLPVCHLILNTY